jgi:hypothetical protein
VFFNVIFPLGDRIRALTLDRVVGFFWWSEFRFACDSLVRRSVLCRVGQKSDG